MVDKYDHTNIYLIRIINCTVIPPIDMPSQIVELNTIYHVIMYEVGAINSRPDIEKRNLE